MGSRARLSLAGRSRLDRHRFRGGKADDLPDVQRAEFVFAAVGGIDVAESHVILSGDGGKGIAALHLVGGGQRASAAAKFRQSVPGMIVLRRVSARRSRGNGRFPHRRGRLDGGEISAACRHAERLAPLELAGIELTDDGGGNAGAGTYPGQGVALGHLVVAPARAGKPARKKRLCLGFLVLRHIHGAGAPGRRDGTQNMRIVGEKFLPAHVEAAAQFHKVGGGLCRERCHGNQHGMIGIRRRRPYAQRVGIAHDLGNGKETRHIEHGFLAQLQVVVQPVVLLDDFMKLACARGFLGAAYLALAAVVGGNGKVPVMKDVVQAGKIAGRRFGGAVGIPALVRPPVLPESVGLARGGNELPHAHGVGTGHGHGVVAAFQIGEIGQILGKPPGTEHALGIVQVRDAVAQEILHGAAPLPRILDEVIADLRFHGRGKISVEFSGVRVGFFLRGGKGGEGTQIHSLVSRFGGKKLGAFHLLLIRTAGKHDQRRHSQEGKAAPFTDIHIFTPSLWTCISDKSRIPAIRKG